MDIHGFVNFRCDKTLDQVARMITTELLGGIEFGSEPGYTRFESPAVYSQRPFLGLEVILLGGDGEYALEVIQADEADAEIQRTAVDLTPILSMLLGRLDGVETFEKREV